MKHITKSGKWFTEIKRLKLIRVENYGEPYNAVCDYVIVNGKLHVEGLLACNDVDVNHAKEKEELESIIKELGFTKYTIQREINGELTTIEVEIK